MKRNLKWTNDREKSMKLKAFNTNKTYKKYNQGILGAIFMNKFANLDEMDKLLEWTKLLKLTHEVENLNIPKSMKEMEQKTSGSHEFFSEYYQILKGEILPVLYRFFQKVQEEKHFVNHFMKPAIPKPDEDIVRKENHRPISFVKLHRKKLMKY